MSSRPATSNSNVWPAAPSVGAAFGVLVLLLAIATTAVAAWLLLTRVQDEQANLVTLALGLLLFLLLITDVLIGYWLLGLRRLHYKVDRNALTIEWDGQSQIVPMPNVVALVPAAELDEIPHLRQFRGLRWPGYRVGHAQASFNVPLSEYMLSKPEEAVSRELTGNVAIPSLAAPEPEPSTKLLTGISHAPADAEAEMAAKLETQDSRAVTVYATTADAKLLYVFTEEQVYAISPADVTQFVTEFKSRQALATTEAMSEAVLRHGVAAHPIWSDGIGRAMLALALIINLGLFAYLCLAVQQTDQKFLIMHWNAQGLPDRTAPILQAFQLPFFALATIAVSFVFGLYVQLRDIVAARFVFAGAAAVQVVFWAAVVNIISR